MDEGSKKKRDSMRAIGRIDSFSRLKINNFKFSKDFLEEKEEEYFVAQSPLSEYSRTNSNK